MKLSRTGLRALFAFLVLAAARPALADMTGLLQGTLGGTGYIISKPDNWNGGLIIFAHGSEAERDGPGSLNESRLTAHFRKGNYAWAAPGYRATGYHPDWYLADTIAIRRLFIEAFGWPRWAIIYGESMGGHVAVAALEQHPELFQGGMTECGAVDGVGSMDWRYAYTAAAEYFSGVPLLDAGPEEFEKLKNGPFVERIGRPGAYTERGLRFDSVVKHLAGGALPLWPEAMARQYLDRLRSRRSGPASSVQASRHADTRQIFYDIDPGLGVDAATLNRDIRRVVPEAGARQSADPVFAPFTGRIRVPLMTLHGTADMNVPFRMEQNYRRRTIAAGTSRLLVQRTQRMAAHCDFDPAAREKLFDDLVTWIERGVVPEGEDVLGDVTKLGGR
jgi:pimeloyl-ACP methyl ester carboxylesterase